MDNLTAHKVAGVCERIQATGGANLLYLPAVLARPEPIEKAFAKLNQF
jgi:hypothetical protein